MPSKKKKIIYYITAKIPMRVVAVFIIIFLVSATTLYFYDVLFSGLGKIRWEGKPFFSPLGAEKLAIAMAMTIGLGVFAESAPTIWDKFVFWGQYLDNKIRKIFLKEEYFLDVAYKLLHQTRKIYNRTNFDLQAIAIPTDDATLKEEDLLPFWNQVTKIKDNCVKISYLLENHQAYDILNKRRQEEGKQTLNDFITYNLEMSARLEEVSNKIFSSEPAKNSSP